MASIHFGLKLVSGPDNIRAFQKDATSTSLWKKGDILTLDSDGYVTPKTAAGTTVADIETAILGVAVTTEAYDANAETNNVHVPVHVIMPEQVWSIKVEDGYRANDYEVGTGSKLGYYGTTTTDYDIGYASGETARTVTTDDFYFLEVAADATASSGATVVALPNRNIGDDLDYGGRVHIRFNPLACMLITG